MMMRRFVLGVATAALVSSTSMLAWGWQKSDQLGYQDTPLLPGGKWHVHDGLRPQPPVVTPGTPSTPEAPGKAPADAVVLFDGHNVDAWRTEDGSPSGWNVVDGAMVVPPKGAKGGGPTFTKQKFGDCQIHLEFATPTPASGTGQGRGNSGLIVMGRYEIQILDCYQNLTYPDGTSTAVYGQTPPLVNASKPPGEWQTYDVAFTAPRFKEDGSVETPAYITVFHNGVLTQNHTASLGPVVFRALAHYEKHDAKEPIMLQDHNNPVRFRNIWVREIKNVEQP